MKSAMTINGTAHVVDHWPALQLLLRAYQLPTPEREYRFAPERRWRADFAWPAHKLLLEVQGGAWTNGRHNRAASYINEMERHNAATILGWRVLYCTPEQVRKGIVAAWLVQAIAVTANDGR